MKGSVKASKSLKNNWSILIDHFFTFRFPGKVKYPKKKGLKDFTNCPWSPFPGISNEFEKKMIPFSTEKLLQLLLSFCNRFEKLLNKETTLERADFIFQLSMFVTAVKKPKLSFSSVFCLKKGTFRSIVQQLSI